MKKTICTIFAVLLFLCLWGCAPGKVQQTQEPLVLTQRQQDILRQQGLPDDYQQLLPSQREAIVAIEEMLQYLEQKYGMEFAYGGYISPGPMEKEQLIAYRASGSKNQDCFYVTKTKEGYEDNFIAVASKPLFEEYLTDHFRQFTPHVTCKVYAEITNISLTAIPEDKSAFDGNTASSLMIFLRGSGCTDSEFQKFQNQFEAFMEEHCLYGMAQIIRIKEDTVFEHLTEFCFSDYLSDEYYDKRVDISLQR